MISLDNSVIANGISFREIAPTPQKIPVLHTSNINNNAISLGSTKPPDTSHEEQNSIVDDSKTNLIINYLPQTMSQEEIRSLFSSIGEVESCKLIRDKQTGQSLGYGFVNYKHQEDATKAIQNLNQLRLQNKTIKVSFARPSSETIKGANLYICGFPKTMTQPELDELFQQCGNIITSRILYDNSTGLSKGVGFIRYDKKFEAELAIEKLNGYVPLGATEKITVKFANNPSSKGSVAIPMALPAPYFPQTRQILGPIHHAAGRFSTMYRFSPFDVTGIVPTATTPAPTPHPPQALTAALAPPTIATTPTPLPLTTAGYPTVQPVSSLSPTSQGFTLFVYNLPPETDDRILWQLFGPFGAVLSVKVINDLENQKCRGFGFVTMAEYQGALTAISSLNNRFSLGDRTLQVSFKTPAPLRKL